MKPQARKNNPSFLQQLIPLVKIKYNYHKFDEIGSRKRKKMIKYRKLTFLGAANQDYEPCRSRFTTIEKLEFAKIQAQGVL